MATIDEQLSRAREIVERHKSRQVDYATEMRQAFIQGGHAAKLADAIRWMRTRGLYCLDRNSKAYTPVHGYPLPFKRSQS